MTTDGNESIGSRLITAYTKPAETKPLAVYLTDRTGTRRSGIWDRIHISYLQNVPFGLNPEFIYKYDPALRPHPEYSSTGGFDMLLIDGAALSSNLEARGPITDHQWVVDYVLSGGILVYMGSGVAMGTSPPSPALARTVLGESSVAKLLFGIDSTVLIARGSHDTRFVDDTLFHYYKPVGADPQPGSAFPALDFHNEPFFYFPNHFDVGPVPFKGILHSNHNNAEVIYTYNSGRNPVSALDGRPNGLRFSYLGNPVYTFFFSPWELGFGQFESLLLTIMTDTTHQQTPELCCDLAGDASNDGITNITDVTVLIERLFKGGPAPVCCEEGSADGNTKINIGDVTYIIAWLFNGGPDPVCGPAEMGC